MNINLDYDSAAALIAITYCLHHQYDLVATAQAPDCQHFAEWASTDPATSETWGELRQPEADEPDHRLAETCFDQLHELIASVLVSAAGDFLPAGLEVTFPAGVCYQDPRVTISAGYGA